jgi:hypothetical protein
MAAASPRPSTLSFLLAYGLGNAVQDFQLKEIVKRGVTTSYSCRWC